ncbi:hypothetical protein QO200_16585 [Flavobacterium sp. Arc3]|jgi:hypothetical protein|uniref:hypothetical protein n=1 Tax=unclassified Flavobacterium TaxID=196869 RepID=UPI00352C4FE1
MNYKKLILMYSVLLSSVCFSQGWDPDPDPGFGGGDGDPATEPLELPIDSIEIPLLITGFIVGIIVIRKKKKTISL